MSSNRGSPHRGQPSLRLPETIVYLRVVRESHRYLPSRLSNVYTSPAVMVFCEPTGVLPFRNGSLFDMSRRNSNRLMMWCAMSRSNVVVNSLKCCGVGL